VTGTVALEGIGDPVDSILTELVPVAKKVVEFPAVATGVDARGLVRLTEVVAVGTLNDGAVTPVKNMLVKFADAAGEALDSVPRGILMFAEAVGILDDGAVTPLKKMLEELADSTDMALDSDPESTVKPPPSSSSSEAVEDVISPTESVTVKLPNGVGEALTPVTKAEVKFAVADATPEDADVPVTSGGVERGPEAVPMGTLELADVTEMLDDNPVPTGSSVEFNADGTLVPKEIDTLELAGAVATGLTAVRGGPVSVRVVLEIDADAVLVKAEDCDLVRERPIRSPSPGL
jgi:hypothetical protein